MNMQDNEQQTILPPRRTKHPSERGKLIRWFYMTLVLLFIALTAGLIFWGNQLS